MRNEFLNRLIAVFTFCIIGCSAANAQGNNFGLSNSADQDMISLSNRLFNLEERSKAFQVKLNFQGDIGEILDSDENSGGFHLNNFRPEFVGSLGKWGYRLRLNLCESFSSTTEGVNNVVDFGRIFYDTDKWAFSFGRSPLSYGTYEFEWNPANVLHYYEFQSNQPDASTTSATVGYKSQNHLLTFELANADRLPVLADFSAGQTLFAPVNHQMQYNLSWRGNMFDNRLQTIWSYTLRHEAKDCITNLLMLGTNMVFGKVNMQFDYNLSLGELDYLGLATSDARQAGLITTGDMVRHTQYQQFLVDLGYWPTKRWNLFTKLGLNCSSSSDIEQLRNYRKTYEYTAAAQYFLDKSQEVRISLSYYGKSINYKEGINLSDSHYNCIELALICRLNIL